MYGSLAGPDLELCACGLDRWIVMATDKQLQTVADWATEHLDELIKKINYEG